MYICIYVYMYSVNENINVSINDYSFKYICVVCYLKLHLYCHTSSVMSNLDSADFTTPNNHQIF